MLITIILTDFYNIPFIISQNIHWLPTVLDVLLIEMNLLFQA